jgi:hypothetical protein
MSKDILIILTLALSILNSGCNRDFSKPYMNDLADMSIEKDAGQQTVNVTGLSGTGSDGRVRQCLRLTAVSSATDLITTPTVDYPHHAHSTARVKFSPVGKTGTATITITVEAAGPDHLIDTTADNRSYSQSFQVTVTSDPYVSFNKIIEEIKKYKFQQYWMKETYRPSIDSSFHRFYWDLTGNENVDITAWRIDRFGRFSINGFVYQYETIPSRIPPTQANPNPRLLHGEVETKVAVLQSHTIGLLNYDVDPNSKTSIVLLERIKAHKKVFRTHYRQFRYTLYFSDGLWKISKFEISDLTGDKNKPPAFTLASGLYGGSDSYLRDVIRAVDNGKSFWKR